MSNTPNAIARWSGPWHIIDTRLARGYDSLESWGTERQAEYFCAVCNDHEARYGRTRAYAVEYRAPRGDKWSPER